MALTTVNRARAIYGIMVKRATGNGYAPQPPAAAQPTSTNTALDSYKSALPSTGTSFSGKVWNWLFPNSVGNRMARIQQVASQPTPARANYRGPNGYREWLEAMQKQRDDSNKEAGSSAISGLPDFTKRLTPGKRQ